MKNIIFFLSENFHFLVVKFSVYLNRRVFVYSPRKQDLTLHANCLNLHEKSKPIL